MQGAFQHRSGRVISFSRFVLAAVFLLAVWLDPTQPSRYEAEAYFILGAYFAGATVYLVATWNHWWLENRLAAAAHLTDIAVFAVMVFLTEGYTSPFFTFFVFIILSATIKWSWRETALTAAAVVLIFFAAGIAALSWGTGGFELQRFVFRGSYLLVLSLVLIWFGVNLPGRKQGQFPAADLMGAAHQPEPPIRHAMELVAGTTEAERVVFAWWEKEEPWVRVAQLGSNQFTNERYGPEDFGDIVPEPLAGQAYLFDAPKRRMLAQRSGGKVRRIMDEEVVEKRFAETFAIESGLAMPIVSDAYNGVIFALGIPGLFSDDLATGEELGIEIGAAMDRSASMALAEETAAARTRLALARDLHDSVIQLLAGTSFRLAGMKKAVAAEQDILPDIDALQHELAAEQRDLRTMIERLRGKSRAVRYDGLEAMLTGLMQKLARQWGIECRLLRCPAGLTASTAMQHDVQQIVREGVSNAVRHGKASSVSLSADGGETGLSLIIADNGSGFPVRNGENGAEGIDRPWSLSERVRALGGSLALYSSSKGSRITISLPYEERP